ncbi:MAG: hypothetical protein U0031_17640 [Thermomicrobiales bacterium]
MHDVELFGVPRLLTGIRVVAAAGETLGDVARDLCARQPALAGAVFDAEHWLLPGYAFVVADSFTRDPALVVPSGTSVLLVATAAGG